MGKYLNYFLFLLWLSYLIVSSILLFTKGFLLTKDTQKQNSTCIHYSNYCKHKGNECNKFNNIFNTATLTTPRTNLCLPRRSRVVLLIIDALRYDFTITDKTNSNPLPFQNKLPIIQTLINNNPNSTRLYKFIAHPPTTTMQRLKALTTGSLPTFIDVGSNFATSEINEDNLIDQLVRNNHKVVFMGDDTWNGLYPNRFIRNYPYPSFHVWDLDTVDNGIISNLYSELHQNDWSLLIGHFLGVDHCGHRYGPNHPEMARKLRQMNDVIRKVVEEIDENTMVFIVGDHGMTATGDHGGESADEVTSALFLYFKQILTDFGDDKKIVKQIDLIPTLSTILGVPIPFSNLGKLILNALPSNHNFDDMENWKLTLLDFWLNIEQAMSYISEYSTNTNTFQNELNSLNASYSILKDKITNLKINTYNEFMKFKFDADKFMIKLRETFEDIWIQFDSFSMTRGLLFLFLSMFFIYMITDGIPTNRLPEIFYSSFLLYSYLAMIFATIFSGSLYYFNLITNLNSTIFFSTGIVSQFMLVMLVVQNWELISLNWYDRSKKERLPNLICRLILIFNLCGLFSNSFIIEESFVLMFLLTSIILIGLWSIINYKSNKKRLINLKWSKIRLILIGLIILILIRMTKYFWRCREEQQWCFGTNNFKFETSKLQWIITVICLALFVTITRIWLRNCGNLNGYSFKVILIKYIPTVLVVCISGFWVLNRSSLELKNKLIKYWQTNMLAWFVYSLISLGIISIIKNPLCIFILSSNKNNELNVNETDNLIPQLFKHIKNLFNVNDKNKEKNSVPIVCGLGTVFSSVFIIIGIYLILLFSLLLGDAIAPSVIIMFFSVSFILIIISLMRMERVNQIDELFDIPNISILVWVILSQYFFYGTGHQATFPNIIWDAAFIGTRNISTPNFIMATLIILNTFSSYIFMGFLLPLLIIIPFTIAIMLPSIMSKDCVLNNEQQVRGELLLYENENLMISSAFTTSCKYIMCHGIRVFASMLAATIHCRHLMVWNIFAPKLIFEAIGMLITLLSVTLGYLLLVRINKKVNHLIIGLTKQCS